MLAAKLQEMEDSESEEEVAENASGFIAVQAEAEEEEAEDDSEESEDEAGEEGEEVASIEAGEDEAGEEEIDGDEDLSKLSVDQFKDMIRDIIAQEVGGDAEIGADMDAGDIEGMGDEAPIEEPGMDAEPEMGAEDEEEIDLDELLRELEAATDGEVEEGTPGFAIDPSGGENALVSLASNLLKAAKAGDKAGAALAFKKFGQFFTTAEEADGTDLAEALETIETLRKDLQEVNLLNSKLLYVNKIFKANNLSESQKVNIIAAFDKAETVKEVKLVFETVSENVVTTRKRNVTESKVKGMASKATGITASKPEVISEVSDAVRRMQKLAGIIK